MRTLTATTLAAIIASTPLAHGQSSVASCPETSTPSSWAGATLDTGTTRDGVTYDAGGGHLELDPAAGLFSATALGITDLTVFAAAADFDNDGWDDFVGTGESNGFLRIYENHTYENPEPDWTDPDDIRTPKFVIARTIVSPVSDTKWRPIAAADFNGDGWPDVFRAVAPQFGTPTVAQMWLNRAVNDASGYPQFNAAHTAISSPSQMGPQTWGGAGILAYDQNGDRKLDLLIANGNNGGEIRVFRNNCTTASGAQPAAPAPLRCSNNPTFTYTGTLISNLGFSSSATGGAFPQFTYGLINSDAYPDLVVGSTNCCASSSMRLRYYPGQSGGTLNTAGVRTITSAGAVSAVLLADFNLDGRLDLITGADGTAYAYNGGGLGGITDYYVNNGTDHPFSDGASQRITTRGNPTNDFDIGLVFDYDGDPHDTPDAMIADGNHSSSYYVFANRVVEQYVACGEAASGVIPLGELADSEMVVTGARLDASVALGGGSVTFWLSNEDPANWVEATDCGDGSGDLCATFPKGSGRDVRWKAELCSDASHTRTPTISGITATFDFTEATEHYRSGVVVHDGVSYVGAFKQPGDRGRFYAINAGLSQTYWEASAKLDAMSDGERAIYTAHRDTGERLELVHHGGSVDVGLVSTLNATNAAQAASVIDWVRSARFGVGNTGIAYTRLGAVETSTPAVLGKPGLPTWYVFATSQQRALVDQFLQEQSDRWNLVLFGSKDGMMHALHSRPTDITHARNGQEAWAYIPPEIAGEMIADYSASIGGAMTVTAYPDGSPTLADVAAADGTMSTIAIIAGGNGGKSVAAIDVTETVDSESEAVIGPTPLWSAIPGGDVAGQAFSKVAVGRARIGGASRFLAIAGTGIDFADTSAPFERGRLVVAYDALTGDALWKFQTRCPLTSDVTVFETDDDLESGGPTIDGHIDRAVFADRCGYVYKVDPNRDLGGGWNGNAGLGAIAVDAVDGVQMYALFSTGQSAGALGSESPIAGTLGAQIEAGTNRMVLFFGTGGLESHPVDQPNEFYGVYADDGSIRSKLAGACTGGRCEKFYGGVVVTQEQVILTRTIDPEVGSATCDRGSSRVDGVSLNSVEDGDFVNQFTTDIGSAVMGALYGDAGALYFATLGGSVTRIGEPRASEAGGDSTGSGTGTGTGTGSGSGTGTFDPETPMTIMGWRQVY